MTTPAGSSWSAGTDGAHDVDAVEGGFGGDVVVSAGDGQAGVGDGAVKVLAHLVFADDLADRFADSAGTGQPACGNAGNDRGEQFLGGGEQFVAFAGAFDGQERVAAGDQPLAGVVGVGDLGEVVCVEQAHLQRPVVGGEFGDLRGAERGDPVETCSRLAQFAQRGDAGGGDHAAVTDQHQVVQGEGVAHRGHDLGERGRVGGVAGKHPHRHRPARRVGEDAVLDLRAALLAVAGVAARGQLAAPPGHPRGRQVEQRHPARIHRRGQMPCRQLFFDAVLAVDQPVHRGVHLVGGRAGHVQVDAEGGVGPPGQGGQLAARAQYPRDDQRQRQIPLSGTPAPAGRACPACAPSR